MRWAGARLVRFVPNGAAFAVLAGFFTMIGSAHGQAPGDACVRAGWIAKIDGPPSEVQIRRRGAERPIMGQSLLVICEGDRIEVQGAAVVHLRINGQPDAVIIRDPPSGYDVPRRTVSSLARNALDYLHDLLLPYLDRARQHARMRVASSGDSIESAEGELRFLAPGLEHGTARLSLADQPSGLVLRWEGGAAPFDISIFGPAGDERYRNVGAQGRRHDAAAIVLQDGRWRVRVRDGAGATIEGAFVVSAAPSPVPSDWRAEQSDESLRVLWLARCHGDEWGFAALQRVGAHRSGSVPSNVMYEMLAEFARSPQIEGCDLAPPQ